VLILGCVLLINADYRLAGAADFRSDADVTVENLVNENFEAVVLSFTPWLSERHTVEELEEVWYRTVQRYGLYESHQFGKTIEKDSTISYLYVINCRFAVLAVVLAYNNDGQIMAFVLQPPEGEPIKSESMWVVPDLSEIEYRNDRIPSYVDTSHFSEVEFTMQGEPALPAVMTVAKTNEPNPVVLLFEGFGPTDRDETIGTVKPFRDIAWGLATQGIASIRFDCRAYTQSTEVIAGYDLDNFLLDDIAAMLAYIRMETTIFDTTRIFLAGHGLGGVVAPRAAKRDGGIAGLIFLSSPARSIDKLIRETLKRDMKSEKAIGMGEKANPGDVAEILDLLERRQLPPNEMLLFAPARIWYELMDSDHIAIAEQLNLPTLIVLSGRDFEASDKDYEIWEMKFGGKTNFSIIKYDELNHFYQRGSGQADRLEYLSDTASVDRQVVDDIASWVKRQ
jgi:pimeloyl-ACP methyl ester carboxylesterase